MRDNLLKDIGMGKEKLLHKNIYNLKDFLLVRSQPEKDN
jgi:hypothetical protein